MPSLQEKAAQLVVDILLAFGVSLEKIDAKVAEWKIAYGDKIPDVEVEAFLAEYASVEELKRIFREAAPEFVNLYKTGRSKFTRDPSALA